LIERRQTGEPVAYLTGERGFWTLNLKTNSATLIPRADTECLVEHALATVEQAQAKVLDLGTGTGAIALSLATEKPGWAVHACDFSVDAVDLARLNLVQVKRDGFDVNVSIQHSDWFVAYEQQHLASFDLIVSNPPYIDPQDHHLDEGDLRFEPQSALVAQNQGYADIFYIIEQAGRFLKPSGWLMIEHGALQGTQVRQCFEQHHFSQVETIKDLAQNERFTVGCRCQVNKCD
ncbi:MAG: peptide chain release factor N(5)-glutamine methyltransferase, partial [Algicola sp.]|nr:peptide chain release factor N(5)-glutamine methyltransferase [Algicola sp.]